jgi:hypothetical protein
MLKKLRIALNERNHGIFGSGRIRADLLDEHRGLLRKVSLTVPLQIRGCGLKMIGELIVSDRVEVIADGLFDRGGVHVPRHHLLRDVFDGIEHCDLLRPRTSAARSEPFAAVARSPRCVRLGGWPQAGFGAQLRESAGP